MGAKANGKPRSPKSQGKGDASMSAHPPSGSIHQSSRSTLSRRRGQKTYMGWAVDKGTKLLIWYTLVTVFFRCPSSHQDLTDTSPKVCKAYLHTRDFVTPYALPYYDHYLSPYVQQAQPYYDYINEKAYQPGYAAYQQYGAPGVAQARKLSEQQWQKTLKPTLDFAQRQAGAQYQKILAPHVKKATNVVQPYYDNIVTSASDIWQLELEPVYRKTAPYAQKLYHHGHAFAVNTAIPQAQFVGSTAWTFWSRQIWPKLRILYGENVEPQLMRITERLGRYKDGKKLEAEIVSMESSSKAAKASSSVESLASSIASTISQATESPSSTASTAAYEAPTPSADPSSQFREDLKSWEHICAKAVEEGAEDLKERIEDITARQVSRTHKLGSALVTQLEQTTESALNGVKSRIQQVVHGVSEDASEEQIEAANEEVVQAIRTAGQNVKHRAQAVREWRQTSQSETQSLVAKALESTLETIDSIRELRLTEIGRKYASSSLPHKEWSKYNDIKKATQSWRNDVEKAANEHNGFAAVKAAGEEIEQSAMAIAEDAAKELGRLKKVGQWKIAANDDSDDFTTKAVPPVAKKIKDQVVEKAAEASEAVFGSEQGAVESATSVASQKASEAASKASEAVYGSTGSVESAASKLSEQVIGSEQPVAESATSVAAKKATEAASKASEAVYGSTSSVKSAASKASEKIVGSQPAAESIKSKATKSASSASSQISDSASSVASAASSYVYGESSISDSIKAAASSTSSVIVGESSFSDSVKASASSVTEEAQRLASELKSKIASNAEVKGSVRSSISSAAKAAKSAVRDEASGVRPSGGKLSSILSEQKENASKSVESAASEVSKAASSVASSVTSTPLASEVSNSVSSASSAASSKVSSASKKVPSAEKIADTAEEYAHEPQKVFAGAMAQVIVEAREPILDEEDDVVDQAAIYSASVQKIINAAGAKGAQLTQAIQDALSSATATQGSVGSATSLANDQYESALSAASSALFGTRNNFDKATSAVQDQYQAAVTAASWAIYGTPATAAPLAAASSAYDRSISEAAKQYDAIKSRVAADQHSAAPDQQQLYASAESAYSSAVTAASYAIYGTPVTVAPFAAASSAYVDAVSDASKQYEAVKSRISEQISGTPKPVQDQMFESAQTAYSNAVDAASSKLNAAFSPVTQNYYESISSVAASRLSEGISAAQEQYHNAKLAVGAEPTPAHQQYLASVQAAYYQALGLAHGRHNEFVEAASSLVAPTPTATGYQASIDSVLSVAKSAYSDYTEEASSKYSVLYEMASHAANAQSTTMGKDTLDRLQGQLVDAVAEAKSKLSVASASVSSAYVERSSSATPLASHASENWEALIAKASEQIYGAPPPFTAQAYSLASEYAVSATNAAAQATQAAAAQWEQVNSLFSELVVGREPDFTASMYSRLQSAYSTGAPAIASQVSSYASDTYDSVSSVLSAAFVPPTQVASILEQVQAQLNDAVEAASAQVYGTKKGAIEQATEAAASVYSDASSQVSEAIYGTPAPYLDSAQSSIIDIGASASSAISGAIYGPSTAPVAAASSSAASIASSIQSKAAEQAASASAAVSSAVYGEEQTYLEGVQSQLSVAMASASSSIAELGGDASKAAEQAASTVSSVVSEATDRIRDEL